MEEEHKPTTSPDRESEMESSPLRSPIPPSHYNHYEPKSNFEPKPKSTAIIAMERRAHLFAPKPIQPPDPPPELTPVHPLSPVIVVNRSIREELAVVTKMDNRREDSLPSGGDPVPDGGGGGGGEDGTGDRRPRAVSSILWRERKEAMVKKAELGFRVCSVVFCLISFSVMAADKTQGWAGDSFDRYKEYRYCLSVTVIGFVYAGFQAYNLAYHLITRKYVIQNDFRYMFDFSIDQIWPFSWTVEPLFVDEKCCFPLKPKRWEHYERCTGGKGRVRSIVSLQQLIQPALNAINSATKTISTVAKTTTTVVDKKSRRDGHDKLFIV